MAQNITIAGASFSAVPSIEVPLTAGGTTRFYDDENIFLGGGAEFVSTIATDSLTLADTTYSSWTASTTATSILATANVGTASLDMATYDYLVVLKGVIEVAYASGATLKAIPIKYTSYQVYHLAKRASNKSNADAGTQNYNIAVSTVAASGFLLDYYNTSGTATTAAATSYGFYMTQQAPAFSSTSSSTPTATFKRPVIYARCSSTYFATGRYSDIDVDETTIDYKLELYRSVKNLSLLGGIYERLLDVRNSGI